jgi:DNA-binding NarL/FixJ family response regulator
VVRTALNVRANGYITKDSEPQDFAQRFAAGRWGRPLLEPSLMEAMLFAPTPKDALNPRESEILLRLATGQSHSVISQALFINEKIVSSHKINLMAKLNIDNFSDLLPLRI